MTDPLNSHRMPARPLYIFDLDGTLALIEHRKHFVERDRKSNFAGGITCDWRSFYAACDQDQPNEPVIRVMETLRHNGAEVWIFSGRSDEVRDKTEAWLCAHTSFMSHELHTALTMRAEGDYTPDDVLKKKWLDGMLLDDRERLTAAFDDRDRVVKMWRDNGVMCFQVAPGEF